MMLYEVYPDEVLVERAVRNAYLKRKPRWAAVAKAFALGSTFSIALCERFGLNPDEIMK